MSLFKELDAVLGKIENYCPYIELEDTIWCIDKYEVRWFDSKDNEVYSGETREGVSEEGDCTLVNIGSGCGETITKVFLTNKMMSWEDFEEKYEDFM